MNFSWLLLALFLVAVISGALKSLNKSVVRNAMRLGSVILAFLITLILQLCGAFQGITRGIVSALSGVIDLEEMLGGLAGAADLVLALASTLVSMLFFVIVYFVLLGIIRIVVHYVANAIDKSMEEKAAAPAEADVAEASSEPEEAVSSELSVDAEEKTEAIEEAPAEQTTEQAPDEASAEQTTEQAPAEAEIAAVEEVKPEKKKAEKPKKKKGGFYPECAWKRAVSIGTGVISGILILAISLMPVLYIMGIAGTATDALKDSDTEDSQLHQIIDVVDKYIVDPYASSFVAGFYDAIAIDDLLNFAIKAGGKITLDDGRTVYADDVLKVLLYHGVSAVAQLTSVESERKSIGDDVTAIVSDPMVASVIADVLVSVFSEMETEEPAEDDLIGGLVGNFMDHYKNADKATIEKDLKALGGVVGVIAERGLLSAFTSEDSGLEDLLADEETLSDIVAAISGLSAFGPTIEGAFGLGIEIMGETLMIPADDAAAYDIFVNDILDCMVKSENVKFDSNTIKNYVYQCATQGKKVISTNGINGYSMFTSYVKHWESVQAAFAHASEDRSYGYFTIEINGKWYVYEKSEKIIVEYTSANEATYKDKISPLAGIINALTLKSTTSRLTEDNLKTVLNAYVNSATDSTSVALARAILNPDSFRTKTVTVEKMMASTDFANWTDEEKANDSRLCVEIIMDLLGLMESLGGMDVSGGMDAALDLVDQFESLGATMDVMKQTSCINGLPELLIEGLVKHEMLSTYMKPSTAHSINDLVQNNNKSYADCMKQIAVNIKWAINAFGGVQ